jgi:uncharacterized protein (TIGR00369 family)
MVARRSAQEALDLEHALRELFERRITFNQVLGLKVDSLWPTVISFPMQAQFVGHYEYGRLHGGVISAVLDATGGLAIMAAVSEKHPADNAEQLLQRFSRMGTIDLRTDFLEQGIGTRFIASAQVNRLGKRLASVQMALHNDEGRLIATASAAYVVS